MEQLKPIIAKNISELRTAKNMTQFELAEYLNYSDKAVSKWERAESVPDIAVLKKIAELFQVSLDYLVEENHDKEEAPKNILEIKRKSRNRKIITGLSILLVWLAATLLFVLFEITPVKDTYSWMFFLYAIPVALIVWLVFNTLWFNPRGNYLIISLLMWSVLAVTFLTALAFGHNIWMVFLLGVPGQIIILLWSRLIGKKRIFKK